jgi:hypothetical protein
MDGILFIYLRDLILYLNRAFHSSEIYQHVQTKDYPCNNFIVSLSFTFCPKIQ